MKVYNEVCAPKEVPDKFGTDYLVDELKRRTAETVIDILSYEPDVVISKHEVEPSIDFKQNMVRYRWFLDWKPIIKCRDCKYRPGKSMFGKCPCRINYILEDFYCAYGEREESNENDD